MKHTTLPDLPEPVMKTIRVSEATNVQLDWLVAKCEGTPTLVIGVTVYDQWAIDEECDGDNALRYTTDWSQMGPILERQEIELLKWAVEGWAAKDTNYQFLNTPQELARFAEGVGPTPLVAAARCYVASKLGDTVEVPEELA
jgi:hypothetical protein